MTDLVQIVSQLREDIKNIDIECAALQTKAEGLRETQEKKVILLSRMESIAEPDELKSLEKVVIE